MLKICGILLVFTFVAQGVLASDMTFDEFIKKFNKPYKPGSQEYEDKKTIFAKNLEILKKKNCPVCGVTKFFDILPKDFEEKMLDLKLPDDRTSDQFPEEAKKVNKVGAPLNVDWRGAGVVTSIKNQGECGSCWSFTTVALCESSLILKKKATRSIDLSEQFLVECTPNSNCGGGFLQYGIDTAIKRGLPKESSYPYDPYNGHSGICYSLFNTEVSKKSRRSYYDVSDEQIKDLLTLGPVAISISSTNWQFYSGGVWKCNQNDPINHAVLLVGYTRDAWLIKNQWGQDWGEDGFMQVSMDRNSNCRIGTSVHLLWQRNWSTALSLICLLALMLIM